MYLYIVRHGKPDYEHDTLVEEGWAQAQLAAERLAAGGMDEIHTSPMGRARDTAQALADRLNLPVQVEDWAYELGEEGKTTWPDGELKVMVKIPPAYFLERERRRLLTEEALAGLDCFRQSGYPERYEMLANGLDDMLARCGYRRTPEGLYRPESPNDRHVALFCHGAMLRSLICHALNIPLQLLVSTLFVHYTAVSVLRFSPAGGEDIAPELICLGDTGHLYADGLPQKHFYFGEDY